ncbi:MAG: cupin domain-containing protein [Myxococcales bacterium]|nr:cupin domain-containing protein [Myxococcales bacterium]
MKRSLFTAAAIALLALSLVPTFSGSAQGTSAPKLENLLRSQLARVSDTEVIVSRVTLAPGAALPKHWHPGEEFAFILEGSVSVKLDGKDTIIAKAGEAAAVPYKAIHSAKSGSEGAVILIFRVHELGEPERVLVK